MGSGGLCGAGCEQKAGTHWPAKGRALGPRGISSVCSPFSVCIHTPLPRIECHVVTPCPAGDACWLQSHYTWPPLASRRGCRAGSEGSRGAPRGPEDGFWGSLYLQSGRPGAAAPSPTAMAGWEGEMAVGSERTLGPVCRDGKQRLGQCRPRPRVPSLGSAAPAEAAGLREPAVGRQVVCWSWCGGASVGTSSSSCTAALPPDWLLGKHAPRLHL